MKGKRQAREVKREGLTSQSLEWDHLLGKKQISDGEKNSRKLHN
jgi:hypothetical protein